MNVRLGLMTATKMRIALTLTEGLIAHAKETILGMENHVLVSTIIYF
jgi:hypothetical protein